jgi:hypothetical protein
MGVSTKCIARTSSTILLFLAHCQSHLTLDALVYTWCLAAKSVA